MAFHDRRTLDGVYSVRQSARYVMIIAMPRSA
jgi:hypothetical protein